MILAEVSLAAFLNQLDTLELPALGTSQIYSNRSILKIFLYAQIRKITSFKLLARMVLNKPELRQMCNLKTAPHRTTLSRRFKSLPQPLAFLLDQLTSAAQKRCLIDISITSTDSTLMKANGNLWHKKNMDSGDLPVCGNSERKRHPCLQKRFADALTASNPVAAG